jgi:outer membrane lipoprotein-sorting protein
MSAGPSWKFLLVLGAVLLSSPAFGKKVTRHNSVAQGKSASSAVETIKSVLRKYQQQSGVVMNVEKKVISALLERTDVSDGILIFSKGRVRMDIKKPEPSLLILNGDRVWMVNKVEKQTHVAKTKLTGGVKSNPLLTLLRGEDRVWRGLKLLKKSAKGPAQSITLAPPKGDDWGDVVELEIKVDSQKLELLGFRYQDELDNKTQFVFSGVKFGQKVPNKEFEFNPPAQAQVTEY